MLLQTAIFIVFYALPGGETQTFSSWADVPTADGLQFIVGCVDGEASAGEIRRGARYRYFFRGSDFYCIADGTVQSSKHFWPENRHETREEFKVRSGCGDADLRLGLTLPDRQWEELSSLARADPICSLEATP